MTLREQLTKPIARRELQFFFSCVFSLCICNFFCSCILFCFTFVPFFILLLCCVFIARPLEFSTFYTSYLPLSLHIYNIHTWDAFLRWQSPRAKRNQKSIFYKYIFYCFDWIAHTQKSVGILSFVSSFLPRYSFEFVSCFFFQYNKIRGIRYNTYN